MFRIAIVEDQEETRECLNRFVRQYAEEQGLQVEISRRQRTAFLTAVASYMGGVL